MKPLAKPKKYMLGYAEEMRLNPTKAEKIFRDLIRERVPGVQSQVVIDNKYILDFFHAPSMICFEIDGASHETSAQRKRDKERDIYVLRAYGITTVRFKNEEMRMGRKELCEKIKDSLEYGYTRNTTKPQSWGPSKPYLE